MNVAQENVTNVLRLEARFAKIDNHVVERRLGSGIEKRDAIIGLERSRGNDSRKTELPRI